MSAIEQAKDLSGQTRRHLGLLAAADRQMARSPTCRHSRPLAGFVGLDGAASPRPGRRDVEDPRQSQIKRPRGAALVQQGLRRLTKGSAG